MGGAVRVCFVCLGNICRSPAAEAVLRAQLADAGLDDAVVVDSAGTSRYHLDDQPDPRTRAEAARRGIPIEHRARQLTSGELERWDLVIAMDRQNHRDLLALAAGSGRGAGRGPSGDPGPTERIRLLRSFDPAPAGGDVDVPDPYYGGDDAFALMFDLIEPACRGLVDHLRRRLAQTIPDGMGHR